MRICTMAGLCTLLVVSAASAGGTTRVPEALPGDSLAVLWVAPSGGSPSCVRAAVAVGFAQAVAGGNVCDSGASAYGRAQLRDTVLVQGRTYTSSWNFA